MKYNGSIDRIITLTQHMGGYVITSQCLGGPPAEVTESFEKAVNIIARQLALLDKGERIVFGVTTEPEESISQCAVQHHRSPPWVSAAQTESTYDLVTKGPPPSGSIAADGTTRIC